MIELLIFVTTVGCPNQMQTCWQKDEVELQRYRVSTAEWNLKWEGYNPTDRRVYEVVRSTKGTECEIKGHQWEVIFERIMICKICKYERKKKYIEHERKFIDVEEFWEDTGERVEKPPKNPTVWPFPSQDEIEYHMQP